MNSMDISLADVLLHILRAPDLREFGMLGFHRLNGRESNIKTAYRRTYVTSTVLLILEKLEGIEFHWRAHAMEDLEFNRDVDRAKQVLCKCYRFGFGKRQLRQGGCAYVVARGEKDTLEDSSHTLSSQTECAGGSSSTLPGSAEGSSSTMHGSGEGSSSTMPGSAELRYAGSPELVGPDLPESFSLNPLIEVLVGREGLPGTASKSLFVVLAPCLIVQLHAHFACIVQCRKKA